MVTFTVGNILTSLDDDVTMTYAVSKYLNIKLDGYAQKVDWTKYKKSGTLEMNTVWQPTYINVYNPTTKSFPTGRLGYLTDWCAENGIPFQVLDTRVKPEKIFDAKYIGPPADGSNGKPPREYQVEAGELLEKIGGRGILWHATGSGKTITGARIMAKFGVKTIYMVPSLSLLDQAVEDFKEVLTNVSIGSIGDGTWNPQDITVCTAATLWSRYKTPECQELLNSAGMFIVDECFPAGTLIDGTPIEDVKVGDTVRSFNETTGVVEYKEVVRVFKNILQGDLIEINAGEHQIKCTQKHPIWTDKGWVNAEDITDKHYIYTEENENDPVSLHNVQQGNSKHRRLENIQIQKDRASILLKRMFKQISQSSIFSNYGKNKPKVCLCTNEKTQPYAHFGMSPKGKQYFAEYGTQTSCTRRQWTSTACASKIISNIFKFTYRICNTYKAISNIWIPYMLQSRYCKPFYKAGNRNRWCLSRFFKKTGTGSQKRDILTGIRVDSVKVYKQRSIGKYSKLCTDSYVYNLEVKDNHTYLANNIIVHNCHHINKKTTTHKDQQEKRQLGSLNSWYTIAINCPAYYRIGLTGSPGKDVDQKRCFLELAIGRVVHRVPTKKLIDLGILSDVTIHIHEIAQIQHLDYHSARREGVLENELFNEYIVNLAMTEHKAGHLVLIVTGSKAIQGPLLVKLFKRLYDIDVPFVSGDAKSKKRIAIRSAFKAGKIPILIGTVYKEGVNFPLCSCGILCDGGRDEKSTVQFLGRVLRVAEGKLDPNLHDFKHKGDRFLAKHSKEREITYFEEELEKIVYHKKAVGKNRTLI